MYKKFIIIIIIALLFSSCTIKPIPSKPMSTPEGTDAIDVASLTIEERFEQTINGKLLNDGPILNIIMPKGMYRDYLYNFQLLQWLFNEEVPFEVNLSITESDSIDGFWDPDDLFIRLMSGDPTFDMFVLFSADEVVYPIIREGYFIDLSEHEGLKQQSDDMFDELREGLIYDGEIFGSPLRFFNTPAMVYSEENLSKAGYSLDEICCLDDLILMQRVQKSLGTPKHGSLMNEYLYLNRYIWQPMLSTYDPKTSYVDISSLHIDTALEKMEQLKQEEIILSYEQWSSVRGSDLTSEMGEVILYDTNSYTLDDLENRLPIPCPQLTEDIPTGYGYQLSWVTINPNSPQSEDSMELLYWIGELNKTNLLSNNKPVNAGFGNMVFMSCFYKDYDVYVDNAVGMLRQSAIEQKFLDGIATHLQGQTHIINFPGYSQLTQLYEDYENDYLTYDEMIEKMQRIVDIASEEYTLHRIED